MIRAACSRASLAGVAAAKEIETKTSAVKSVEFIVREWVDQQAAAEIPKHLLLLGRLSRHAQSKEFREVRAHAQCSNRRRLPLSRCRVCRASSRQKCPCAHYGRASIQRCRGDPCGTHRLKRSRNLRCPSRSSR